MALFVDAEHKRPVGWRQVKPDNVTHLVDEHRITRELECLCAMGLQPKGIPDSTDCRMGEAGRAGHRADRPMRCVARRCAQRALDHGRDLIIIDGSRSTWPRFVEQALDPIL